MSDTTASVEETEAPQRLPDHIHYHDGYVTLDLKGGHAVTVSVDDLGGDVVEVICSFFPSVSPSAGDGRRFLVSYRNVAASGRAKT